MRRQARLFAIAEFLRGRRSGVTAEQIARRFDVTVRTVYRDLDALREAHLPVGAERGRGGGYALDRAYTLPPVNLDAREAAVLLTLGRYAERMRLLPFTSTLHRAIDKVRAALSASAQRELVALVDALDFVGVPQPGAAPAVRAAIEQAWFEQRLVRIGYVDRDGNTTTRRIRLCRLWFDRSATWLVCEDVDKGGERQLRLDRITHARVE